ncbi:MAG: 23S rRNA (uracil(1939)-C(5))-methyltransferase RlmD [Gammaproteobacteria bacterium]
MLPESIEINITSLSHDGRGIAEINGKTTFVTGALPQEKVTCKISKKHSRYNDAEVIDVITASPDRTTPPCAHFSICGGCSMQHINANAQIILKQQALLDQLKRFGNVVPEQILPPIVGNTVGYRRKARLGVRYVRKKEKLLVGFREKMSNYLADIEQCIVLHPSVGIRLTALSELVRGLSQYEQIPQIEVAVSDQATALVFRHMTDLTTADLAMLVEFGKKYDFQIYLQPNSPARIHKIWPNDQNEMLSYFLPDHALEMRFHPLDFTQVNGEVNRLMIKQALQMLDPQSSETVLDLFCGLGNFTLPIARLAKHVVGIEGSIQMVERARENAAHNQISNTEFHAANLMENPEQASWAKKSYDKILIDPPRTGAKEIIPFISTCQPKRIVYVSCNPATLARDAGELVYNHHYKLKQIGVINMFPHTSHIEAIALFEK